MRVLLINQKNMKKYLLSSIILTVLLSGIASAEIAATGANRVNEIKQKITDIKQKAAEEKAVIKARMASTTADIKNLRNDLKDAIEIKIGKKLDAQKIKIANEFEMAIKNLNNLIAKTESRISKMQTNNIDVSAAKILLETAKTKVALAQTEVTNLENLLTQNIPAATSTSQIGARKTALQSIRTQSDKTKTAIKTTQKAIIDVINSLKPGLNKQHKSTSTSENNSTSTN